MPVNFIFMEVAGPSRGDASVKNKGDIYKAINFGFKIINNGLCGLMPRPPWSV
jgi:hypothetical protein